MKLQDFLDITENQITDGSEYNWHCYGHNARTIGYWDNDSEGVSADCVYDTKTSDVREITVMDYAKEIAYRWIDPKYYHAYRHEARWHQADDNAWDDVAYIDLYTESDIREKARAILKREDFDRRVEVELDLDKNEMFDLMSMAHERDMTLNRFIELALSRAIKGE